MGICFKKNVYIYYILTPLNLLVDLFLYILTPHNESPGPDMNWNIQNNKTNPHNNGQTFIFYKNKYQSRRKAKAINTTYSRRNFRIGVYKYGGCAMPLALWIFYWRIETSLVALRHQCHWNVFLGSSFQSWDLSSKISPSLRFSQYCLKKKKKKTRPPS